MTGYFNGRLDYCYRYKDKKNNNPPELLYGRKGYCSKLISLRLAEDENDPYLVCINAVIITVKQINHEK